MIISKYKITSTVEFRQISFYFFFVVLTFSFFLEDVEL